MSADKFDTLDNFEQKLTPRHVHQGFVKIVTELGLHSAGGCNVTPNALDVWIDKRLSLCQP